MGSERRRRRRIEAADVGDRRGSRRRGDGVAAPRARCSGVDDEEGHGIAAREPPEAREARWSRVGAYFSFIYNVGQT